LPSREEPTIGVVTSLDRATIWPYDERGEPGDFYYQRDSHPIGAAAERALGELDGGHALLFPSGMGATTALVLSLLEPGATIALAAGAYYGTGRLFASLERWGLKFVEFDQTGAPPDGVQLIWVEAPSNPFLTMPDLEAAAAHAAPLVVDATAATPIHLRPLEHGADFVLTARRSTSRATTTSCSEPSSPGVKRTRRGCTTSAPRRASSAATRSVLASAAQPRDAAAPGRASDGERT
jgi:cystathionine beta-lyase/cystathionine gamma-synthase